MAINEASPAMKSPKTLAFYIGSGPSDLVELPVSSIDPKFSAEKSDGTTSASMGADGNVWKEQGSGPRMCGLSVKGRWRRAQTYSPHDIKPGADYYIKAYFVKPGTSDQDPQLHEGYFECDDREAPFDINNGVIEWSASFSSQGYIQTTG